MSQGKAFFSYWQRELRRGFPRANNLDLLTRIVAIAVALLFMPMKS
jgi:hypothetical protein